MFSHGGFLVYVSVLLLATAVVGQNIVAGPCPHNADTAPMANFDWNKFQGKWYHDMRTPYFYDASAKCQTTRYMLTDAKSGLMEYAKAEIIGEVWSVENATITIPDPTLGLYVVKIPSVIPMLEVKILTTDYTTYAAMYGCADFLVAHMEFAWVKTRWRFQLFMPSTPRDKLQAAGVDMSKMIGGLQIPCPVNH